MFHPLREFNLFGMFMDPAAVMLIICVPVYFLMRTLLNRLVDLNRYVWHRPLVDLALMVILYSVAVLTLKPI
jgi:hypothetical protein